MSYPVNTTVKPEVQAFFDEATNTISYIVKDPSSNACAIVDSVMDIDYAAGRITYDHADELIRQIETQGLTLEWIIETHVHADHLSAAPYLQQKLGGKIGIGSQIMVVQETFGKVFNEGTEFQRDGSQFDRLFEDGDTYMIGNMQAFTMYTPGHTPACMVHVMGDARIAASISTVNGPALSEIRPCAARRASASMPSRRCAWTYPMAKAASASVSASMNGIIASFHRMVTGDVTGRPSVRKAAKRLSSDVGPGGPCKAAHPIRRAAGAANRTTLPIRLSICVSVPRFRAVEASD